MKAIKQNGKRRGDEEAESPASSTRDSGVAVAELVNALKMSAAAGQVACDKLGVDKPGFDVHGRRLTCNGRMGIVLGCSLSPDFGRGCIEATAVNQFLQASQCLRQWSVRRIVSLVYRIAPLLYSPPLYPKYQLVHSTAARSSCGRRHRMYHATFARYLSLRSYLMRLHKDEKGCNVGAFSDIPSCATLLRWPLPLEQHRVVVVFLHFFDPEHHRLSPNLPTCPVNSA